MTGAQVNRASGRALVVLSFLVLLTVLSGYFQVPQPDEGSAAHIFQIAVALFGATFVLFLATADWKQRWPALRPAVFSGTLVLLAFGALYYLEHIFYPAHSR